MMILAIFTVGAVLTVGALVSLRLADARRRRVDVAREHQQQAEYVRLEAERGRQARRQRLADRAESNGIRNASFGELVRWEWAQRFQQVDAGQELSDARLASATSAVEAARDELNDGTLPTGRAVAVAAMLIWFVATIGMWLLDVKMVHAQGHEWLLAVLLGTIISAAVEALGLTFFAALGVHPIGFISGHGLQRRVAVGILSITALVALTFAALIPLSKSRTEEAVGDDLRRATSVLAAAKADGTVDEVQAAELSVDAVQQRFDRGQAVDATLAATLAALVFGLSWAPVNAADHRRLQVAIREKQRAEAEATQIPIMRQQLDREFTAHIAEILDEHGGNPADVETLLLEDPSAAPALRPTTEPVNSPHEPLGQWPEPSGAPEVPSDAGPPATGTFYQPPNTPDTTTDPDPFDLFPRS